MGAAQLTRAETLLDLRRPAEAEGIARSHIVDDPNDPRGFSILARALQEQARPLEGCAAAAEAVRLAPGDPHALVRLADLSRDAGDHRQALGAAEAAVQDALEAQRLAPHSADVLNLIGLCHSARRQRKAERAAYEEALRLDPGHHIALNNLAAMDLARGRIQRASHLLDAGLAQAPQEQVLQQNVDVALLLMTRRLWWMAVLIAVVEGVMVGTKTPWAARAAVGAVCFSLVALLVRRTLSKMPRGTAAIAAGLYRRASGWQKFLLITWCITALCTVTMAFGPEPAALGAAAAILLMLRFLLIGGVIVWIAGLVRRD